jgi:hypothetical protein
VGPLKRRLFLLPLVACGCCACVPTNIESFRKDVEAAFRGKSFMGIADKHCNSQDVLVSLENEYDEENRAVILDFKSVPEMSKWFFDKHEQSEHMIIPSPAHCSGQGCSYDLPELTLHHGVYLRGFDISRSGRCMSLTRLRINWS